MCVFIFGLSHGSLKLVLPPFYELCISSSTQDFRRLLIQYPEVGTNCSHLNNSNFFSTFRPLSFHKLGGFDFCKTSGANLAPLLLWNSGFCSRSKVLENFRPLSFHKLGGFDFCKTSGANLAPLLLCNSGFCSRSKVLENYVLGNQNIPRCAETEKTNTNPDK